MYNEQITAGNRICCRLIRCIEIYVYVHVKWIVMRDRSWWFLLVGWSIGIFLFFYFDCRIWIKKKSKICGTIHKRRESTNVKKEHTHTHTLKLMKTIQHLHEIAAITSHRVLVNDVEWKATMWKWLEEKNRNFTTGLFFFLVMFSSLLFVVLFSKYILFCWIFTLLFFIHFAHSLSLNRCLFVFQKCHFNLVRWMMWLMIWW